MSIRQAAIFLTYLFIALQVRDEFRGEGMVAVGRSASIHPPEPYTKTKPSRVLLITAVFSGKAANKRYLRMFLESAASSGVDVLVFGDRLPYPLPGDNLHHHPITWPDFLDLANSKLFDGRPVLDPLRDASNYKIVDFKPLYAHLFPELVSGYDWWGHCDNDLVLGNVAEILQPLLHSKDTISVSDEQAALGPFQLYRNTPVINELFLRSKTPLEEILVDPGYKGFDETHMSAIIDQHADSLGLRVQRGVPAEFVYDGFCHHVRPQNKWPEYDLRYPVDGECAECLYKNNQLVVRDPDGKETLVLGCHYEFSKTVLEESLHRPGVFEHLLETRTFRVGSREGFRILDEH